MISEKFVILGVIIGEAGLLAYAWGTLKGRTKPNRISWSLWALAPLIIFAAEIDKGVGIQALVAFMAGFTPLLVLGASFANRKSYWRLRKFDYMCGGLSIAGLILWGFTREGNIAIILNIAADALASLPTFVKSYKHPESESSSAYLAAALGTAITILTINHWDFATYAFPIYFTALTLILGLIIKFKIGKRHLI